MDIKDKTVMVLGGWGLVGRAISIAVLENKPRTLVLTSLRESEAREIEARLRDHATNNGTRIVSEWGDIFVRQEYRFTPRSEVHRKPAWRKQLIADVFDDFDQEMLERSAIFHLLKLHRPDIVIDCINTATAVAYQNPYDKIAKVRNAIKSGKIDEEFVYNVEESILSQEIPQLIRHMQILIESMRQNQVNFYLKIGTTGTGGMGFNIPYTHSEVKPSRLLLGKSSIAGAHTMMLFLLGRTPEAPIVKEIKPAAAIAWKEVDYGKIKRRGRYIPLYDLEPSAAKPLQGRLRPGEPGPWQRCGEEFLESVYIDAGENGYFSLGEFAVISSEGQMEFVTPEEIADRVIMEIRGGTTGSEIVSALDGAVLGPSYRAALIRQNALQHMLELQEEHRVDSVGFELLGPPRLTKLLYEAYLIRRICRTLEQVVEFDPPDLSRQAMDIIKSDGQLRRTILSIGTPILLADGNSYLRGPEISEPGFEGVDELEITPRNIRHWTANGWVDLRPVNFQLWKDRIATLQRTMGALDQEGHSSYYYRTRKSALRGDFLDIGRVVSWILEVEDGGFRMK